MPRDVSAFASLVKLAENASPFFSPAGDLNFAASCLTARLIVTGTQPHFTILSKFAWFTSCQRSMIQDSCPGLSQSASTGG